MAYIRETGFDGFHFDSKTDIRRSLAIMQANAGWSQHQQSANALSRQRRRCAARGTSAVEAGLTLIAPECALPLACPLENLRAIPGPCVRFLSRRRDRHG